MESVLNKGVWLGVLTGVQPADSNEERVLAGTIVALIEIREAIEERLGVLATGQLVIAKEIAETITNHLSPEINGQNAGIMQIAEAIHENTAVQGEIVARAGTIEQQGVEMLEGFDEIRGDLESMRSAMEATAAGHVRAGQDGGGPGGPPAPARKVADGSKGDRAKARRGQAGQGRRGGDAGVSARRRLIDRAGGRKLLIAPNDSTAGVDHGPRDISNPRNRRPGAQKNFSRISDFGYNT